MVDAITPPHQLKSLRIAITADPELPVPPVLYGGIERIIDLVACGLAERGHRVTLFANGASTCPVERVAWPGGTSGSSFDILKNSATLTTRVTRSHFDIVHSFSRLAYLLPILPYRIPKLMSYGREISPRTTTQAARLSQGTLEFTAVSHQMINSRPLNGVWHMIPNGVPIDTFSYQNEVHEAAPLVFLGRVEEIKGPHLAIEIARRTNRRLIIAGNIPDAHRSWFETNIAPHVDNTIVRYIGPVDDKQKDHLLRSAAALLMPILWEEPFGMVMTEAMACGTPVLGLRRGAVPEVVEDGITGYVADTVDELVACVGRLNQLSRKACRARVERLYSASAVTEGYLAIYNAMIARRSGQKVRQNHPPQQKG